LREQARHWRGTGGLDGIGVAGRPIRTASLVRNIVTCLPLLERSHGHEEGDRDPIGVLMSCVTRLTITMGSLRVVVLLAVRPRRARSR
jgi:hypothetical protein